MAFVLSMRYCSSSIPNPPLRLATAILVVTMLAAACSTRQPAPVDDRAVPRPVSPPPVMTGPSSTISPPPPAAGSPAPAVAPTYTVKRGDTLHQIALDTGLDYRELAAWNNIENANVIRVGQVLRLAAPGDSGAVAQEVAPGVTTSPLRAPPALLETKPGAVPGTVASPSAPASTAPSNASAAAPASTSRAAGVATSDDVKTSPKAIKEPYSEQAVRELTLAASAVPAPRETLAMAAPPGPRVEPAPEPKPDAKADTRPSAPAGTSGNAAPSTSDPDHLDWAWPTKGKIISGFSDTANLKGIDIGGTAGQAVHASAAGRVVYAGSGLRGYGKLIIIKHNATYLSAYAHNREILVKEGQQVTRGQKIAEMGNTDADQVKLHFEIRRQGKPMDPTKYLPPA
jgi:lipoprotein NlpD